MTIDVVSPQLLTSNPHGNFWVSISKWLLLPTLELLYISLGNQFDDYLPQKIECLAKVLFLQAYMRLSEFNYSIKLLKPL